jgi:hypothetical protein
VSMTTPPNRIKVVTSVQRCRCWTAFEKARMVEETFAPGMTVSLVARQHAISAGAPMAARSAATMATEVRVAFALDCCDREAMSFLATTGDITVTTCGTRWWRPSSIALARSLACRLSSNGCSTTVAATSINRDTIKLRRLKHQLNAA